MKETVIDFIETVDGVHMGIGIHIDEDDGGRWAALEIAASTNREEVRRFVRLEGDWCSTLSGKRTNALRSPFTFIRFFRRKWQEILSICAENKIDVVCAEPEFSYLAKAYSYLERMGFRWDPEEQIYEYRVATNAREENAK